MRARLTLVEGLHRGDPVDRVASRYLNDIGAFGGRLLRRLHESLQALDRIPPGDVTPISIQRFRDAVDLAQGIGDKELEAALSGDLAARLLETGDPRAIEEVIALGTRALAITTDHDRRLALLANLSSAYAGRHDGDRAENWNRAYALLVEAGNLVERTMDPRRWAVIRTNLAFLLEQRPGRTADDLRAALVLVKEGLEERSPTRNVVNWAYSQLHLGLINLRLYETASHENGHASNVTG